MRLSTWPRRKAEALATLQRGPAPDDCPYIYIAMRGGDQPDMRAVEVGVALPEGWFASICPPFRRSDLPEVLKGLEKRGFVIRYM